MTDILQNIPVKTGCVFFATFAISTFLSYTVREFLVRYQITRKPSEDRWHKKPVPIFGGIAIYCSFAAGSLFFAEWNETFITFFVLSSVLFGVGLVDDLFKINPPTKLTMQLVSASIVVISGYAMGFTRNTYLNMAISLFLIVCVTNSFNLLDNMDGLSAGVAVIVLFFRALFFLYDDHYSGFFLSVILAAAISGFLVFNFNPASIFMGDCGSLFIGFAISSLVVIYSDGPGGSYNRQLLYVLLLAIPIFDTFFVAITRKISGRKMSQGGKDHLSHRLVHIGLTERNSVLFLYALAASVGFMTYYIYRTREFFIVSVIAVLVAFAALLFAHFLSRKAVVNGTGKAAPMWFMKYWKSLPYKRFLVQIVIDLCCIVVCYYFAYVLRFRQLEYAGQIQHFSFSVFIVVPSILLFLMLSGVYRGTWRYISIPDYISIAKGVVLGSICAVFFLAFYFRFIHFSRAVVFINVILLLVVLPGIRASSKLLGTFLYDLKHLETQKKVLIYGAGDTGEMLLRLIKNTEQMNRRVVGFIDDDKDRQLSSIYTVKVLGGPLDLPRILRKIKVDEILVSTVKITDDRINELKKQLEENKIEIFRHEIKLVKV